MRQPRCCTSRLGSACSAGQANRCSIASIKGSCGLKQFSGIQPNVCRQPRGSLQVPPFPERKTTGQLVNFRSDLELFQNEFLERGSFRESAARRDRPTPSASSHAGGGYSAAQRERRCRADEESGRKPANHRIAAAASPPDLSPAAHRGERGMRWRWARCCEG